jgi:hypothetical protein
MHVLGNASFLSAFTFKMILIHKDSIRSTRFLKLVYKPLSMWHTYAALFAFVLVNTQIYIVYLHLASFHR